VTTNAFRQRWLALLAMTLTPYFAHGDDISVKASREGNVVMVEAQAQFKADARLAWGVLTAYDQYAEFVPDLEWSRVLVRSGHTAIIEQRGTVGYLFFHFPLEVRLAVTETPFERVTSYAMSGDVKEMTGTYELLPEGPMLKLVYNGRIVPAFQLPPFVGMAMLRRSVEQRFRALVTEIRRREELPRQEHP